MTALMWIALILGIAGMCCGIYALVRGDPQREQKVAVEALSAVEDRALNAGIRDVFQDWIEWAADTLTYEQWEELTTTTPSDGYRSPSPMNGDEDLQLQFALEQQPRYRWGLEGLRRYMADLRMFRANGGMKAFTSATQISARLTEAAAIITDLRDDSYNPGRAPTTGTWAFHKTTSVRTAYLAGRSKGTENIMDAVTKARTDAREVDSASEAIAAANELHAAALRALRETNQKTAARDAHEEFRRELDGN